MVPACALRTRAVAVLELAVQVATGAQTAARVEQVEQVETKLPPQWV